MSVTYYAALPFARTEDGPSPGEAQEMPNERAAIRRAEAMSAHSTYAGALPFKRSRDPTMGNFNDAVVLRYRTGWRNFESGWHVESAETTGKNFRDKMPNSRLDGRRNQASDRAFGDISERLADLLDGIWLTSELNSKRSNLRRRLSFRVGVEV
jgi:hypothetical protein